MSNLLDHFPLRKSAIYIHSIFNHPIINPPTGSTELPGSKASRWRRGGGSPSWDKICNGPVKGLKTEWQALPRGSVAPFSGFDFEPNCGLRKGGNGFFGWGRILFPWKINKKTTLKIVLFQLVLYQKKWSKFRQDDLRSLDYQRLPSSPKSHSLMHRDAVVSRFSSVALKPWGTVQSAFFLEVHSISILDTLHLHKWS